MSFAPDKVIQMMPYHGINNRAVEQNIPEEYCADAQNVRFAKLDIDQRGGFAGYLQSVGVPLAPAAAAGTGFYSTEYSTGNKVTVAAAGTVLAKDNGAGAWANVKTGLTAGQDNLFSFVDLNDLTIATNGVDPLFKYSDSVAGTNLIGTPPGRAKAIMVLLQRVVIGNPSDANRHLIQWCGIGNPDDWVSNLAGSAEPIKKGQEVRALGAFGTDAFVFYNKSIQQMHPTGDSTKPFVFTTKDPGIGAMSQVGLAIVPDGSAGFFVGQRGVYKMEAPDYIPRIISRPIDGIWRTLNKTRLKFFSAKVNPLFDEVWFTVSTGSSSTNNAVLVYNFELDAWTRFTVVANALGLFENASGDPVMTHCDYSGMPYLNESGNQDMKADGTFDAIDAYATSRAYTLMDGMRTGEVARIELDVEGQPAGSTVEFNHGYDLGGLAVQKTLDAAVVGDQWDVGQWDVMKWAADQQKLITLIGDGHGRKWQWQVRNRKKNTRMRVHQVRAGIIYQVRKKAA